MHPPAHRVVHLHPSIHRQPAGAQGEAEALLERVGESGGGSFLFFFRCAVGHGEFQLLALRAAAVGVAHREADLVGAVAGEGMLRQRIRARAAVAEVPQPLRRLVVAQVVELHLEGLQRILLVAPARQGYIVDAERVAGAAVYGAEAVVGLVGDGEGVEGRQLDAVLLDAAVRAGGIRVVDDVQAGDAIVGSDIDFAVGGQLALEKGGGQKIKMAIVYRYQGAGRLDVLCPEVVLIERTVVEEVYK